MWVYGIGISIWKKFPHSPTFKFNGTVHFNILLCRREPNIKCKHMIGFKYCCLQIGYRFRDNMLNVKKMQIDRSGRLQLQMCVTWYTIHKYILYLCIWTKYSPFEEKKMPTMTNIVWIHFPTKTNSSACVHIPCFRFKSQMHSFVSLCINFKIIRTKMVRHSHLCTQLFITDGKMWNEYYYYHWSKPAEKKFE